MSDTSTVETTFLKNLWDDREAARGPVRVDRPVRDARMREQRVRAGIAGWRRGTGAFFCWN